MEEILLEKTCEDVLYYIYNNSDELWRFINADTILGLSQDFFAYNLYSYASKYKDLICDFLVQLVKH